MSKSEVLANPLALTYVIVLFFLFGSFIGSPAFVVGDFYFQRLKPLLRDPRMELCDVLKHEKRLLSCTLGRKMSLAAWTLESILIICVFGRLFHLFRHKKWGPVLDVLIFVGLLGAVICNLLAVLSNWGVYFGGLNVFHQVTLLRESCSRIFQIGPVVSVLFLTVGLLCRYVFKVEFLVQ
ncbi:hypothetical protein M3Y96_00165600 [Aphelenchoides besseyi]|nr:hypothetical protein M3Y96_00165600 [Aphelenchoides besseyi]